MLTRADSEPSETPELTLSCAYCAHNGARGLQNRGKARSKRPCRVSPLPKASPDTSSEPADPKIRLTRKRHQWGVTPDHGYLMHACPHSRSHGTIPAFVHGAIWIRERFRETNGESQLLFTPHIKYEIMLCPRLSPHATVPTSIFDSCRCRQSFPLLKRAP